MMEVDLSGIVPVIASIPVTREDGKELGMLELYQGEEVADIVARFCVKNALPMWFRRAMVEKVCQPEFVPGAQCTRKRALLFEAEISSPDPKLEQLPNGPLQLWDDENIQMTVHNFIFEAARIIKEDRKGWELIMKRLESERNTRKNLVEQNENSARLRDKYLDAIEKLTESEKKIHEHLKIEPANFNGETWFEEALLKHVCALPSIDCSIQNQPENEFLPDMPISVGNGDTIGILKARRGEEAVDVAFRFGRDHSMNQEFIKELGQHLCKTPGYGCTRDKALSFSQPVAEILGLPPHQDARIFQVWAEQQAADAAYAFAPYDLKMRNSLMAAACTSSVRRYVDCDRGDAVRFRFPVNEGAVSKGDIILYEHQKPIDAVYEFCKISKYLQPKYTALQVRQNLQKNFCHAFLSSGLAEQSDFDNCQFDQQPREKLFTVDFNVYEHAYSYRFYDDDFRDPHEAYDRKRIYQPGALAEAWDTPHAIIHDDAMVRIQNDTSDIRGIRAAQIYCARIWPPAQGCEVSLAPVISAQIRRAKRRRYEIVSPFGYDYYLALRELRDANNQTLRHAYLRELLPLPSQLFEATSNLSAFNATIDSIQTTNHDIKLALASIRGRRKFLSNLLDDTLDNLVIDDSIAIRAAILTVQLTATQTALTELQTNLFDLHDLLTANTDILCHAQNQSDLIKNGIDFLEVQSRVLNEASDTLLKDPEKRASNDKPCEGLGACCAKETPNGGKDIKCGDNFDDN